MTAWLQRCKDVIPTAKTDVAVAAVVRKFLPRRGNVVVPPLNPQTNLAAQVVLCVCVSVCNAVVVPRREIHLWRDVATGQVGP